jgi:hypothetical protein
MIVGIITGAYVSLQFLCSLLAAIEGLGRRKYSRLSLDSMQPRGKETMADYRLRTVPVLADILLSNMETNDDKVSRLALGHAAIRNAVMGLLVAIVALIAIAAFAPLV